MRRQSGQRNNGVTTAKIGIAISQNLRREIRVSFLDGGKETLYRRSLWLSSYTAQKFVKFMPYMTCRCERPRSRSGEFAYKVSGKECERKKDDGNECELSPGRTCEDILSGE